MFIPAARLHLRRRAARASSRIFRWTATSHGFAAVLARTILRCGAKRTIRKTKCQGRRERCNVLTEEYTLSGASVDREPHRDRGMRRPSAAARRDHSRKGLRRECRRPSRCKPSVADGYAADRSLPRACPASGTWTNATLRRVGPESRRTAGYLPRCAAFGRLSSGCRVEA